MFVEPEVKARLSDGRLHEGFDLYAAQVLLVHDGGNAVRLNDEVRAAAFVRAAGEVKKGQDVTPKDIAAIEEVLLFDDEEPDAAHVTFLRLADGWWMNFDFRYNAQRIANHLRVADEHIETAADALAAGRLHVFVDNAYSATELCAKAELISAPDPALMKSKKHETFRSRYNWHAKLGNTEQRFAALLNDLRRLREPARYLEGKLDLDAAQATEMLSALRDLREHAERVRPKRAPAVSNST